MKILAAWLGTSDINVGHSGNTVPKGPIAQALAVGEYDLLLLLANQPKSICTNYITWLNDVTSTKVELVEATLTSPTNFREIYETASETLEKTKEKYKGQANLSLHLSPGTSAMSAVWIILGRTKFPAQLIQTSIEKGFETADIPLEIAAEFIPDLIKSADERRQKLSSEKVLSGATFGDILYRSNEMQRLVSQAKKIALSSSYVLVEGESGTGKELLATAIHNNSLRSEKPLVVVNCGAIPSELIESEFFGHKKGAFTGAEFTRKGAFDEADGGTLFLDEVGDLPLNAQVKLLRALQEGEIKPVGETKTHSVDVRIIAATNKNLVTEVAEGRFREDLYYRLIVIKLCLPSLRERKGDITLLADKLLGKVNKESKGDPGYISKKLSVAARNIINTHSWPGNIRELLNTLRRVTLLSETEKISEQDMREAIQPAVKGRFSSENILNQDLSDGINLKEIIRGVATHYLKGAMKEAGENKSKAAKILGLPNYQTLTNWLKKYDINL